MTKLEDRLRHDLPALADVIMEDPTAQLEKAASATADRPGLVVELSPQPARTKRRWPAVALAAAAVAAVMGHLRAARPRPIAARHARGANAVHLLPGHA